MATVYTANSIEDRPASIETNPTTNLTSIVLVNGSSLFVNISGDAGATISTISYTFTAQTFTTPKAAVDYLNGLGTGTAPNDIEWYVPGTTETTITGGIFQNTGGMRVGIRTKTYKGFNSLIRIGTGTALTATALNFPFIGAFFADYRGIEGYTRLLVQPSPGDPCTAQSANIYEKGLRDRAVASYADLKRYSAQPHCGYSAENYGPDVIKVEPIPAIQLIDVDSGKPYLTYTNAPTYVAIPGIAANTKYYLYAYYQTATLNFEFSTTAPAANRITKSGDATRKYICSCSTDGASVIRPFRKEGDIYTYLDRILVLNQGNSIAAVDIPLTDYIPPTTQLIKIGYLFEVPPALATEFAFFYVGGLAAASVGKIIQTRGITKDGFFQLVTNTSQEIAYNLSTNTDKLSIWLEGYYE